MIRIYKIANKDIAHKLASQYDIETLQEAVNIAQNNASNNVSGAQSFTVGQKLTYTKASGYKGWCTVQEVNNDGTLLILDHSGRYMGRSGGNGFKPVQMGKNMFEEMQ